MFCDLVGSTALSVRFDPEELRAGIACCTAMAQRTASTTLANSTSNPSPVVLTMRPWCSAIFGSRSSRRSALRRSSVPSSSVSISREYPATSAARIAASRRVARSVLTPVRRQGREPRAFPSRKADRATGASTGGHADCCLAPPRLRTWFRRRHRSGLCDIGADRLCRALRLHRDRYGMQSRRPALCRGQGRADPGQQPHRGSGRSGRQARGPRKSGAKGP